MLVFLQMIRAISLLEYEGCCAGSSFGKNLCGSLFCAKLSDE